MRVNWTRPKSSRVLGFRCHLINLVPPRANLLSARAHTQRAEGAGHGADC